MVGTQALTKTDTHLQSTSQIISRWTCSCLVESHCPLVSFVFEIYWAFVTKSRMPAHGIIEPVDISGDGIFGLKAIWKLVRQISSDLIVLNKVSPMALS